MVILIVIFLAFFAAAALLMLAVNTTGGKEAKQTRSRLEQIRSSQTDVVTGENVDVRRIEQFSTLPWLNDLLLKLDLTERVRLLLQQADLSWTVGRLLLTSAGLACLAGYPAYLRTGAGLLSLMIAGLAATAPFAY